MTYPVLPKLLRSSSVESPASFIKIISLTPLIFRASSTPLIDKIFPAFGMIARSTDTSSYFCLRSVGVSPSATSIAAFIKLIPVAKGYVKVDIHPPLNLAAISIILGPSAVSLISPFAAPISIPKALIAEQNNLTA